MTTMAKHMTKAIAGALVSIKDADKGTVEAVFSTFNVKDHDGDLTLPGAFEQGAAVAISAYGHGSWRGLMPVGRGVVRADQKRAILEGQFFLDTVAGMEMWKTIKAMGELQEWSYGFDVLETGEITEQMRQNGVYRVLKKLHVFEVSPVLRGAGVDTETLDVKEKPPVVVASALATPAELTAYRKQYEQFITTHARLGS